MRVAHIMKATRVSGAERHLLLLLPALRERGVDARLVLLVEPDTPMDEMLREARDSGIPTQRILINRDMDLALIVRLRRALKAMRPDFAHTHLAHADVYGLLAARLAGVGAIISSRHNDDQFRRSALWRQAARLMWRGASGGIAISGAIKRFAVDIEGVPADKIRVVHYGMAAPVLGDDDLRAARRRLRHELELPGDAEIMGMVCRLVEQKGVAYALDAFVKVADSFPNARLVIAGDGPLSEALKARAVKQGIDRRVHWLGWRDDGPDLIAAFDVMLLPSLWEGFGLVLLEAMSRRVPVIASGVSAIPEIARHGETGLLTEPRDVDGLAAAMRRLLADPDLRQRMGQNGVKRLAQRFSIERMVDGTLEAYASFGKPGRGNRP